MKYNIIKASDFRKYNELKQLGKRVAWSGNGLIAFYE